MISIAVIEREVEEVEQEISDLTKTPLRVMEGRVEEEGGMVAAVKELTGEAKWRRLIVMM